MPRRKSFRVPAGRVVGLRDLRARMATANDMAYHLEHTSSTADFREVMEALDEAYWIAAALASNVSRTGCQEHPQGPVDPEPPEGWSACLFCNTRRRIGSTPRPVTGKNLTGATSYINRPREALEAARRPSPPEAARWRQPAEQHLAELAVHAEPAPDHLRVSADRTRAAAIQRARQERAARKRADEEASGR